jgi:hypothetical protein
VVREEGFFKISRLPVENWIPTVRGKYWFAYFRFYRPTEAYFERSWPLPDFDLI